MGRKHGFRGTPVRPPRSPATVAGVFERRGDPMVSPREGREKYGRNLETENPDMDRYFAEDRARERAANALLRAGQVDKGNAFRKANAKPIDPQRLAANAVLKMEREMRKNTVNVKSKHGKPHKIKGNFFYFPDQHEKIQDETHYEPRPFSKVPAEEKTEKKKCSKRSKGHGKEKPSSG